MVGVTGQRRDLLPGSWPEPPSTALGSTQLRLLTTAANAVGEEQAGSGIRPSDLGRLELIFPALLIANAETRQLSGTLGISVELGSLRASSHTLTMLKGELEPEAICPSRFGDCISAELRSVNVYGEYGNLRRYFRTLLISNSADCNKTFRNKFRTATQPVCSVPVQELCFSRRCRLLDCARSSERPVRLRVDGHKGTIARLPRDPDQLPCRCNDCPRNPESARHPARFSIASMLCRSVRAGPVDPEAAAAWKTLSKVAVPLGPEMPDAVDVRRRVRTWIRPGPRTRTQVAAPSVPTCGFERAEVATVTPGIRLFRVSYSCPSLPRRRKQATVQAAVRWVGLW